MPSCDPALLVDMVADALAGAAVVRIVAAVSPWESFAVCGRPAPARLKRHTSLWFNSSARNLCDIPDPRYPSGRDVAEIKAVIAEPPTYGLPTCPRHPQAPFTG